MQRISVIAILFAVWCESRYYVETKYILVDLDEPKMKMSSERGLERAVNHKANSSPKRPSGKCLHKKRDN